MELLMDAQWLKTVMSVGACFPKLMKEFVVKNDGTPHGL